MRNLIYKNMDEKTYVFDQGGNGLVSLIAPLLSQRGVDPSVLALLNNRNSGFGGEGGWFIWVIFLFFLMGWGGNGWGNGGNRGLDGTGFLANQLNNDAGRDLLLQAIQGNSGAISTLAGTLNTDISAIQSAICGVNTSIANVGSQVGMSGLQVQNAIQAGNQTLAAQLAQCCCDNRLLTTQQGYESRIQSLEQTANLTNQASNNTREIVGSIADLKTSMTSEFCSIRERELQSKIDALLESNSTLRNQISNAEQTTQIAAMIQPLKTEIASIKASQPNTVPVQWPNLTAVNMTPTNGYYQYGNNGSIWA